MIKEFREFIAKGNVLDLAVGIIIGGAFGKIVSSLVEDVLMPPIGAFMGSVNFADKFVSLDGKAYATLKAAKEASAPVIGYGSFITNLIQFLIVAFAVFLIVKAANHARERFEANKVVEEAPDANTQIIAQNEKMIALLETLAAKP